MKEIIIASFQDGQRLDHLLERYLPAAGRGFICRMLRKKNITVNDKKCEAGIRLHTGDSVKIWFSDETLAKFSQGADQAADTVKTQSIDRSFPKKKLDIVYEDEHLAVINKPAGMLSQKAEEKDVSLCEYLIGYMLRSGQLAEEDLTLFRPSVANRLDRNTSGLVCCGKSIAGLQGLGNVIAERRVRKFYRAAVLGTVQRDMRLDGYLIKDKQRNQVRILQTEVHGAQRIVTAYEVLGSFTAPSGLMVTDLKVELVTGRSHQIRAHLASIGCPILGDPKYGDVKANRIIADHCGIRHQMLHAWKMEFPAHISESALTGIRGRTLTAELPPEWKKAGFYE